MIVVLGVVDLVVIFLVCIVDGGLGVDWYGGEGSCG